MLSCRPKLLSLFWLVAIALASILPATACEPPTTIEFNRDIRPILSDACFACHGPDPHSRQADLRLDERQAALDANAILPGNPQASAILERILSNDPDTVMPPPKTGKTITQEQRDLIAEWIRQGAKYQTHWA
ncbi:MAG: c-type cytochrome, partial [Planctomycetota bacterium]|nr:c-type cytochrome [Planctomycetota bacterium]